MDTPQTAAPPERPPTGRLTRLGRRAVWAIRMVVGVLVLLLGLAGLVLPGLQGILLLTLAAGLLAIDIPWRRLYRALGSRRPWLRSLFRRLRPDRRDADDVQNTPEDTP